MPSVSKSQQRLMGMAYAVKSGDMEISDIDPAYRDKVKSLSDGMTKKDLKKYASTKHEDLPETVDEAFIGPFVFNDKMSDEELLGMYNGALDGYANYAKGMHYAKSDYKKAYQEIEKILKKRGVELNEDAFSQAAQHITPSANIGGMGPVIFPSDGGVGSGDVPAVADIDDDEEEAKKDKTKKKLEMENFKLFTQFNNFIKESLTDKVYEEAVLENAVRDLHFETDPEKAEEMKIAIGASQGEVTRRKQIEGGEYSLRRFRKEIKYDETGEDLGVFKPGSYMAATSKLGDGPHKKAVKKIRWNQKMYDQWIEDVASNGGWEHAFDMAQNAKHERGLIDWVKKNYRDDDPMQRIQWDIEGHAESVVAEASLSGIEFGNDDGIHPTKFKPLVQSLKKNKVKMEVEKEEGEHGYSEVKLTGKRKDIEKVLADIWGPDSVSDYEDYFESVVTEGSSKEFEKALAHYAEIGGHSDNGRGELVDAYWKLLNKKQRDEYFMALAHAQYAKNPKVEWAKDVTAESVVTESVEKVKDHFSEWTALNEKKLDRDDMIKWIEKSMDFVSTTEEFNGSEGGIWVSGEAGDEYKGRIIYSYYSEDYKNRTFGVDNRWEKELNKRGWYSEWNDPGTSMIWPL